MPWASQSASKDDREPLLLDDFLGMDSQCWDLLFMDADIGPRLMSHGLRGFQDFMLNDFLQEVGPTELLDWGRVKHFEEALQSLKGLMSETLQHIDDQRDFVESLPEREAAARKATGKILQALPTEKPTELDVRKKKIAENWLYKELESLDSRQQDLQQKVDEFTGRAGARLHRLITVLGKKDCFGAQFNERLEVWRQMDSVQQSARLLLHEAVTTRQNAEEGRAPALAAGADDDTLPATFQDLDGVPGETQTLQESQSTEDMPAPTLLESAAAPENASKPNEVAPSAVPENCNEVAPSTVPENPNEVAPSALPEVVSSAVPKPDEVPNEVAPTAVPEKPNEVAPSALPECAVAPTALPEVVSSAVAENAPNPDEVASSAVPENANVAAVAKVVSSAVAENAPSAVPENPNEVAPSAVPEVVSSAVAENAPKPDEVAPTAAPKTPPKHMACCGTGDLPEACADPFPAGTGETPDETYRAPDPGACFSPPRDDDSDTDSICVMSDTVLETMLSNLIVKATLLQVGFACIHVYPMQTWVIGSVTKAQTSPNGKAVALKEEPEDARALPVASPARVRDIVADDPYLAMVAEPTVDNAPPAPAESTTPAPAKASLERISAVAASLQRLTTADIEALILTCVPAHLLIMIYAAHVLS